MSQRERDKEPTFVTIRVYMDAMGANLDRSLLESSGIPAYVRGEMGATWMGLGALAPGGIRLDVPRERVEEARALLGLSEEDGQASGV
ncbi:MAG: putative signal transducing protein [Opitutales bacterium]